MALLVLALNEISLQPELSRPPRFQNPGGGGTLNVTYTAVGEVVGGLYFPFLILDIQCNYIIVHLIFCQTKKYISIKYILFNKLQCIY